MNRSLRDRKWSWAIENRGRLWSEEEWRSHTDQTPLEGTPYIDYVESYTGVRVLPGPMISGSDRPSSFVHSPTMAETKADNTKVDASAAAPVAPVSVPDAKPPVVKQESAAPPSAAKSRKPKKKVEEMSPEEKEKYEKRVAAMREGRKRNADQLAHDRAMEWLLESGEAAAALAKHLGERKVYEEKDLFHVAPKKALTKKQRERYEMTQFIGAAMEENKKRKAAGEVELSDKEIAEESVAFLAQKRAKQAPRSEAPAVKHEQEVAPSAGNKSKESAQALHTEYLQKVDEEAAQRRRKESGASAPVELKQPETPTKPRPPVEASRQITSNPVLPRPLTQVPTINPWKLQQPKREVPWK